MVSCSAGQDPRDRYGSATDSVMHRDFAEPENSRGRQGLVPTLARCAGLEARALVVAQKHNDGINHKWRGRLDSRH